MHDEKKKLCKHKYVLSRAFARFKCHSSINICLAAIINSNFFICYRSDIGIRHDSGGGVDETRVRFIEARVGHGDEAADDANQFAGRIDRRSTADYAGLGLGGSCRKILEIVLRGGAPGAGIDPVPGYAKRRSRQT